MKIDAAQPDAMNAIRPWALRPPLDMPGQTCGTFGPQQLEDCSLVDCSNHLIPSLAGGDEPFRAGRPSERLRLLWISRNSLSPDKSGHFSILRAR